MEGPLEESIELLDEEGPEESIKFDEEEDPEEVTEGEEEDRKSTR